MSCNGGNRTFSLRPATKRVAIRMKRQAISSTYKTTSRDRPLPVDPDPRRRRRSPPGLAHGRRTNDAGGAWARRYPGQQARGRWRDPEGHVPATAIMVARRSPSAAALPFCRFARSGPRTPGAKTHRAGITTGRCGWIAHRAATGSGATTISMISLSRSITTAPRASPAAAAPYSCIWRAGISRRRRDASR